MQSLPIEIIHYTISLLKKNGRFTIDHLSPTNVLALANKYLYSELKPTASYYTKLVLHCEKSDSNYSNIFVSKSNVSVAETFHVFDTVVGTDKPLYLWYGYVPQPKFIMSLPPINAIRFEYDNPNLWGSYCSPTLRIHNTETDQALWCHSIVKVSYDKIKWFEISDFNNKNIQ